MFSEYFHGDNGAGLGAAHQTGWTGIVADMIRRRHGRCRRSATSSGPRQATVDGQARRASPHGRKPTP